MVVSYSYDYSVSASETVLETRNPPIWYRHLSFLQRRTLFVFVKVSHWSPLIINGIEFETATPFPTEVQHI